MVKLIQDIEGKQSIDDIQLSRDIDWTKFYHDYQDLLKKEASLEKDKPQDGPRGDSQPRHSNKRLIRLED